MQGTLGFDAMDIQFCDEDLAETIDSFSQDVVSLSGLNGSARTQLIKECEQKASRVRTLKKGYNLEMRQLNKSDQKVFQAKLREHDHKFEEALKDFKWAKSDNNRSELLGDRVDGDPNKMDGDTMLKAAVDIQGKTEVSLGKTKQMVDTSKEVGMAISGELEKQRDQIRDITDEMMSIEDKLKRADRLIRNFTKRMMTDKVIMCFTFLVVIGIAVIIIYATLNPDQSEFLLCVNWKKKTSVDSLI